MPAESSAPVTPAHRPGLPSGHGRPQGAVSSVGSTAARRSSGRSGSAQRWAAARWRRSLIRSSAAALWSRPAAASASARRVQSAQPATGTGRVRDSGSGVTGDVLRRRGTSGFGDEVGSRPQVLAALASATRARSASVLSSLTTSVGLTSQPGPPRKGQRSSRPSASTLMTRPVQPVTRSRTMLLMSTPGAARPSALPTFYSQRVRPHTVRESADLRVKGARTGLRWTGTKSPKRPSGTWS